MEIKKNTLTNDQDTDLKPRRDFKECTDINELCRKHILVKYNYIKYLIDDIEFSINNESIKFYSISRKIKKQRNKLPTIWAKIDRLIEWRSRHH
jgi:hypothetical protein